MKSTYIGCYSFIAALIMIAVSNAESLKVKGLGRVSHELVLTPNEKILANHVKGDLEITAVSLSKREVKFNGATRSFPIILQPRRSEYGDLGAYQPANRYFFDPRSRVVYNEYELHGKNTQECLQKLISGSSVYNWIWNKDGYVVGIDISDSKTWDVVLMRLIADQKTRDDFPPHGNVLLSGKR